MKQSKTNTVLDILYSKEYTSTLDVYKHIFEIHEAIHENPEYLELIQSKAKSNEIVFDLDGFFFGEMASSWVKDYSPDAVIQAIENVVPKNHYQDVIARLNPEDSMPSEIFIFLILSLLEISDEKVIELNFKHFKGLSEQQALELKQIVDASDKKMRINVSVYSLLRYYIGEYSPKNNPVFHVFENEIEGYISPRIKKSLRKIIVGFLENYNNYFDEHKEKKPYIEEYLSRVYPFYFCYKELFTKEILRLQGTSDSGDLVLEHLEKYKSELTYTLKK